jgi:hypothetical protein
LRGSRIGLNSAQTSRAFRVRRVDQIGFASGALLRGTRQIVADRRKGPHSSI